MTGDDIKEILGNHRAKQAEISEKMEISPQSFNMMLHSPDVKSSIVEKFAAALGMSAAELYEEFSGQPSTRNQKGNIDYSRLIATIEEKDRQISRLQEQVSKLELIMEQAHVTPTDRAVTVAAMKRAEETGGPAAAIQLEDGTIITGRTSQLLGATSAMLLSALKHLAGISKDVDLISPIIIEPICQLKTDHLGNTNPRLHSDEILIALSICALTDLNARKAMQQLRNLKGCEAHTSVIISQVDMGVLRKLGVNLTSEPVYQTKKLYHGN